MIYGIEFTTDLRDKQTRIKTFPDSKKGREKALDWKKAGGGLAWPSDPKNAHHRLREIIRCDRPVKPPKKAFKEYEETCRGRSAYPRRLEDFHANAIRERGQVL